MQPTPAELRKRHRRWREWARRPEFGCPRFAWTVGRRLQPLCDVATHCLWIERHPARDGRDADALADPSRIVTISPSRTTSIPQSGKEDIIADQHRLLARILGSGLQHT